MVQVKTKPQPLADSNGLTPKMEAAAVALAGGATLEEAAKASDSGETTVKTWQARPEFKARVIELRAELTARVTDRIALGMCTAVDTLERLCRTGKTESTQLKAAEVLLTKGIEITEVRDLKTRLELLEQGANR